MKNNNCPTCGRRAEPKSRYCPACYTVFDSASHGAGRAGAGDRSRAKGRPWGFAILLFAALGGAWFYQIDTEDWSAEPASLQARARDMKRAIANWASRGDDYVEAGGREGPPVESADVRQSSRGCAISRTVSNSGSEPITPVIVTFLFKAADGSTIGRAANATWSGTLPPGASRRLTFQLPCPDQFESVRARSVHPALALGPAQGEGEEERLTWFLENAARLPCAAGASCEVVIRFPSGDLANFLLERRGRERTRFYALDQRGIDLLSAATRADLIARAPDGGTRAIPIDRRTDESWQIVQEPRLSAAGEPRSENGGI